jgi:CubicO group peptidase (beta-lactamase class C family)
MRPGHEQGGAAHVGRPSGLGRRSEPRRLTITRRLLVAGGRLCQTAESIHLPTNVVRLASMALLSLSILSGCAVSPADSVSPPASAGDDKDVERLAARVDALRADARLPGLALVVLRDTTVRLARGFGFADLDRNVPVTPDTPFNIASVTKPISAVVALRLVERGLLDLDRPMTTYQGFGGFCADVRAAGGMFFSDYACDRHPLTLRHVLSMTANGVPGTRFFYNPASYSWSSRPMAEVAGATFSDLTAREVFEPAGMTQSARIHRRLALTPPLAGRLATPYHIDASGRVVRSDPPPPQGDGAAGGVISTAMDLARFDIALTEGRLLTPAARQVMWSAGRSPSGAPLPYGLGWYVQEHDDETLLWHSGVWDGAYSALYLKAPARGLTLILLANSDGLKWGNRLDEAAVHRSPFAAAFLEILR